MKKFELGEWCFCDFQLSQITKMEDDRITQVSDGCCLMGSYDLSDRCYPLEMYVKIVSDDVLNWWKKFHLLEFNSLNHPGLHRELVKRWVKLCDNRADKKKVEELLTDLSNFCKEVIRKVNQLGSLEVQGVSLLRG